MAYYQLKYYKEIESHGNEWRVEIWQDNENDIESAEIGPVLQGLRLVVQGDQADIDTPIVKTSLEMVFVDAPELELGKTDRKCGDWEEFYTSSATEYQVRLYKNNAIEWTGYITPDSFSEDLRYRGSVTIIARDNLGTLQDTTCDLRDLQNADGKVYVVDVIDQAVNISTCAMDIEYNPSAFPYAITDLQKWEFSGKALFHMVDAAYLGEMNWQEAFEAVLYSIGAVMRYVGGNRFVVVPVRDLPKMGHAEWWDVPVKPATFLAYGHRELVPAVKSITETQEWGAELENEVESVTDYQGTATLAINGMPIICPNGTMETYNVPAWGYTNARTHEAVTAANSCLLNVQHYAKVEGYDQETWGAWDDESIIYMALNNRVEKSVLFTKRIYTSRGEEDTPAKVKVGFALGYGVTLSQDYSRVLNIPTEAYAIGSQSVDAAFYYAIKHTDLAGGNVRYYDTKKKEWGRSRVENLIGGNDALVFLDEYRATKEVEFEIELPSVGDMTLELIRWGASVSISSPLNIVGMFGRVYNIHIDAEIPEDLGLLEKRTITTNYSDKYAVRLTRDPKISVNPTTLPEVAYIPNALLIEGSEQYSGSDDWVWMHGREWDEIPAHTGGMLTRLIHQQLLCWHSKPNNLLTGEIACDDPTFNALYEWNGKRHYLVSGTLNCLTGRMEGATLREFERYDRLWETYAEQDVYEVARSSTEQVVDIVVRSQKTLTANDIKRLGGELLNYGVATSGNVYTYKVGILPPFSGERVVTIDNSARVLIRAI